MVLREIVSLVEFSRSPVQIELFLINAVLEPVIAHIKSLGAFHADLSLENIVSS